MTRATILQIGDIHYSKFARASSFVDDKDHFGAPAGIATAFATPIPALVARAIENELEHSTEALVAVCGDLAEGGDLDDFDNAIKYLQACLSVGDDISPDRVHVVPGNHDVDLNDEMKFVDLGRERFRVLQTRANAAGSSIIVTDFHRETSHVHETGSVYLHSVNSALANGAPRTIEMLGIVDPLASLIRTIDSSNLLGDAAALSAALEASNPGFAIQESLDMPVIPPEILADIQSSVANIASGLVVVIAHHGFLPQATPRFGPYTEMINGGQVRRRLLQLGRPLLYLHGHIHEDSVEVIRGSGVGPNSSDWPVVTISAPLLREGFNRIDIEYARDGRVLGLILQRIRVVMGTGSIVRMPAERISIGARRTIDFRYRKFFVDVMSAYGMSGADLIRLGEQSQTPMTKDEVEDIVTEAVWAGILESASDEREPFETREYLFR